MKRFEKLVTKPNSIDCLQYSKTLSLANNKVLPQVINELIVSQEIEFKNIEHLKIHLSQVINKLPLEYNPVAVINKVKNYNPASNIKIDKIERLNLALTAYDNCLIYYGEEFPTFVYRGQTKFYDECKPTIFRKKTETGEIDLVEKLIDLTRSMLFEEALSFHPYIKLVNDRQKIEHLARHPNKHVQFISKFLYDYPFYVNRKGILQHYGFPTNLLDTTSNIDVAAFFATCENDETTNKYKPIEHKENGVLYVIAWFFPEMYNRFELIGWQPLTRPKEQRASSLNLLENDNLNVMRYVLKFQFQHDISCSRNYCDTYTTGEDNLFSEDKIDNVVYKIKNEHEFDDKHILLAYNKLSEYFPNHKLEGYENMREYIKRRDISIIENIDIKNKYMYDFENKDYRAEFLEIIKAIYVRTMSYVN